MDYQMANRKSTPFKIVRTLELDEWVAAAGGSLVLRPTPVGS